MHFQLRCTTDNKNNSDFENSRNDLELDENQDEIDCS